MWCVQSSERTEKRIRKRPIIAGIDPQKQAKPARFAEDVPEILDQLNSMPLVGIAETSVLYGFTNLDGKVFDTKSYEDRLRQRDDHIETHCFQYSNA